MSSIFHPYLLEQGAAAAARSRADALTAKASALSVRGAGKASDAELWAVAEGFEEIFINVLLKSMRGTDREPDEFLGESAQTAAYRDMYYGELAHVMAQRRDGLGVARMIHDFLAGNLAPARHLPIRPTPTMGTAGAPRVPASPLAPGELPVDGEITSGFGLRQHPVTGAVEFHEGVDIGAPMGAPVRALREGRVIFSGAAKGYGNVVVVEHANGLRTLYGHNRENLAQVGERVAAGQAIARVGSTGLSTGPHLHFEVHRRGEKLNPLVFVQRGE